MKAIAILFAAVTVANCVSLTPDFITGFESGVFVRNNDQMFADYKCPQENSNN